MITEFLPQFDPEETYLSFIPSFLEEVDREYLIHVKDKPLISLLILVFFPR